MKPHDRFTTFFYYLIVFGVAAEHRTRHSNTDMSAIEKVKSRLAPYPQVRYTEGPSEIEVHPTDASGFTVGLRITAAGFTVNYDGWREEFTSENEALDCFAFGLSAKCRLVVVMRGNTESKWVVDSVENGEWMADSETGLLLQPFWVSMHSRCEFGPHLVW